MKDVVEKVRKFVSREDLSGTELKLKEKALKLDAEAELARSELEQLTKSTNEKQVQVVYLSQRLEALVQLIVEVQDAKEESEPEESHAGEEDG